jgi:beta-phosphoglucomutase family hydrolase
MACSARRGDCRSDAGDWRPAGHLRVDSTGTGHVDHYGRHVHAIDILVSANSRFVGRRERRRNRVDQLGWQPGGVSQPIPGRENSRQHGNHDSSIFCAGRFLHGFVRAGLGSDAPKDEPAASVSADTLAIGHFDAMRPRVLHRGLVTMIPMRPACGAVLWDLDGTLVDSEEYHWRAWKETMDREGITLSRQDFLATFGQRNDAILSGWLGKDTPTGTIERIGDTKEARYRELVRLEGLAPLPGAAEWVERLHTEGWRQAIASSAPRANVEAILDVLQFRGWFQAAISAEDVRAGKPDPEVFLTAASRLGAEPRECIVIEDARAGVEAARRAGMRSIGVGRNAPSLGADLSARTLSDLPADVFASMLSTATEP